MRFRQSTLKVWGKCPLQAYFSEFERLPQKPGSKATFGSCIHAGLDTYNRTGDIESSIKVFAEGWENPATLGLPEIEVWNRFTTYGGLHKRGIDILRGYDEQMRWEQRSIIATEWKFLVPFGKHELTGTVDLVSVRKNHRGKQLLTICDYKALAVDMPVLTPTGWVPIGHINLGDSVIGGNGKPVVVTGVYPQGRKEAFEVSFDDGASVVCSADHLWTVMEFPDNLTRTVRLSDLGTLRVGTNKNHVYSIPTVEPVRFSGCKRLPIDPYIMGVLIGDGSLTAANVRQNVVRFTKPDPELQIEVAKLARLKISDAATGDCFVTIPDVRAILDDFGLLVKSKERFIPDIYMRASIPDRQALLAGLMDSDGSSSNRIQYRTGSPRLAENFLELCRSLGGIPSAKPHRSYYKHNGVTVECGPSWHCSPNTPFNPFRAATKGYRWRPPRQRVVRYIDKVTPIGEAEMVCIRVADPAGLFVTKDMIVTHNTNTKKPTAAELALNIQFTCYIAACSQPEFWFGNGTDEFPAMENAEWYWEMLKDMPKRGMWIHLWDNAKELDAGGRDDEDFGRLYRLCNEIERAVHFKVFVPNPGDACTYCSYSHDPCPQTPPTREWWEKHRADEDENSWI